MRCPILSELPSPPEGKSGWPWTEETPQIPEAKPDGPPWPTISIVTPSYNQGQFIEETIRSILLQGYPNLEYIISDGGSTDDTVEVIKKYEPWLTYWASEPDRGQSHAINKGLKRVSGEVIAYLNSDDIYLSGTVQRALSYMTDQKEVDLVYGDCCVINDESQTVSVWRSRPFDLLVELCQNFIYQPTVFMKRKVLEVIGFFDEELHHTMDVDYWLRAATQMRFGYLPSELAGFRITEGSKTGTSLLPFAAERERTLEKFFDSTSDPKVAKWRNSAFSWHHYHAGTQFYVENKRDLARRDFFEAIKLKPFSLKAVAALLAIFDTYAGTNFFTKAASTRKINLKPSPRYKFH
ncbi:MAG: glycosyltransferase [Desulforhopalus sp.]|nr:glycosyltransferase [Desulforhopalus sp.]